MNKFILINIILILTVNTVSCGESHEIDEATKQEILNESLSDSLTFEPILNSAYFPNNISTLFYQNKAHYVKNNGVVFESFPFYKYADNTYNPLNYFYDDLTIVSKRYEQENGYTFDCNYADTSGQMVIDETFSFATDFKNGFATVKLKNADKKWCLINTEGKHIIEADGLTDPYKNVIWIRSDDYWGLAKIDPESLTYKMITNFDFIIIGNFIDELCWVEDKYSEKRAFINLQGKLITPWYDNATDMNNGLATFESHGKWGAIDKSGTVIIAPQYDYLSSFSEGLAAYCTMKNGDFDKWGFINKSNQVVIEMQFGWACDFVNNYAQVRENNADGLTGFINKNGALIISYQFDQAYNFYEGYAAVQKGDKFGFIDTTGKLVIDYKFDKIVPFPNNALEAGFSGGVSKVRIDEEEFFIDKKGNCILGNYK